MNWMSQLAGHGWTIFPTLRHDIVGRNAPDAMSWRKDFRDQCGTQAHLAGLYRQEPGATRLVVVLHGLGGDVTRSYCVGAACAAHSAKMSSLRLAMRGADDEGRDLHHAGLVTDLGAILGDETFSHYDSIYFLGYSLGGHVALKAAIERVEPRLKAVAAVSPPLDLAASQGAIDAPGRIIYRRHVIAALKRHYARIARQGQVPTPVERVQEVKSLREWDALTVVPRFGFEDVDHYYRTQSVSSHIERLDTPALVVASNHDPMIPMHTLTETLSRAPDCLDVRWIRGGGHVFFDPRVDLGFGEELGVERQILSWFAR